MTNEDRLPTDLKERVLVDIEVPAAGTEETGWDVFALTYAVPEALSVIITPIQLRSYKRIFRLLWSIARASQRLRQVWRDLSTCVRVHLQSVDIREGMHKAALLRHTMFHLVSNLQSYLTLDVCGRGWEKHMANMKSCVDLDDAARRHAAFVASLEDGCLLTLNDKAAELALNRRDEMLARSSGRVADAHIAEEENESLYMCLQVLLSICMNFADLHASTFEPVILSIERRGRSVRDEESEGQLRAALTPEWVENVNYFSEEFNSQCLKFSQRVAVSGARGSDCEAGLGSLAALAARLDFNCYFSHENASLHTAGIC
eukprot:GHVR01142283.1.p1 GENE.GHVR01142283.1~~GHVR01142283.1.p1  ORF type:complete len:317 (+),score=28.65 GHVR01142283.1:244-1194(+)